MFPVVSNIVLTADCGQSVNLRLVAQHIVESSYNPKRFSAVIIRFRKPHGTVLLFPNGKMVCNGVKTFASGLKSFRKVTRRLTQMGIRAKVNFVKISNVVATSTLGFEIDLTQLYKNYCFPNQLGFWEPELFPNLVLPLEMSKAMIFRTGKLIFTGAKNIEDIITEFETLFPLLEKYKKV